MKYARMSSLLSVIIASLAVSAIPASGEDPTQPLRPHMGQVMFYHSGWKAVVMFARRGEDPVEPLRAWKWNGSAWETVGGVAPEFRYWNAMAFDTRRQRLVAFGGKDKEQKGYSDMWEWDGDAWVQLTVKVPPGRAHHAMAYDEARGKTVLFGGHDREKMLGDTWEWDGTAWRQASDKGPAPRCLHAMAYDPERKRVVLIGGSGDADNRMVFSDFWEWDGAKWTELQASPQLKRSFHAAAYDGVAQCLVLSGGFEVSHEPIADAWQWRGRKWRRCRQGMLLPLEGHLMAFDPPRKQLIIAGGWEGKSRNYTPNDKTWIWDGKKWTGY